MTRRLALSFSGAGHLVCYQLGAAKALMESKPAPVAFGGSSAGAFAAVACAVFPWRLEELALEHAVRGECLDGLCRMLEGDNDPDRRARECSGRVHVALTRCRTGDAATLSEFESLEHLATALVAGAAIPPSFHPFDMFRGEDHPSPGTRRRATYPYHHGFRLDTATEASASDEWFVDGGIAAAAGPTAQLDERTGLNAVVVAPFSGGDDPVARLSPRDPRTLPLGALPDVVVGGNLRVRPTLRNLRRLQHSVAADEAVLRDFYARGVDDGFAWLSEHGEALSDG